MQGVKLLLSWWEPLDLAGRRTNVNRCLTRGAGAGGRVTAGYHLPRGAGRARLASARRARRAPARQGATFADAPAWMVPRHFPAEAVALVVIVSPFSRARTTSLRHSRADGAAGLTRGGGSYAVRRSGGLWPARPSPIRGAARVPLSSPLRAQPWRASARP